MNSKIERDEFGNFEIARQSVPGGPYSQVAHHICTLYEEADLKIEIAVKSQGFDPAADHQYAEGIGAKAALRRLAGAIAANMPLRLADQFLKECGV